MNINDKKIKTSAKNRVLSFLYTFHWCLPYIGPNSDTQYPRKKFFRWMTITIKWLPLRPYTSCKFSEKSNGRFLRKFGKCQFRAQNDYIWAQYPESRIFPKNPALSLFYLHGLLTSCKVSEKTNERLWRKVRQGRTEDSQTDRQTEGQGWIYRTTPASHGSKNNKDYWKKILFQVLYYLTQTFRTCWP